MLRVVWSKNMYPWPWSGGGERPAYLNRVSQREREREWTLVSRVLHSLYTAHSWPQTTLKVGAGQHQSIATRYTLSRLCSQNLALPERANWEIWDREEKKMERERSNVGTFCFKYEELPERQNHQKEQEEQKSPTLSLKAEMRTGGRESRSSLAELHRTKLNYSQEDIHALASKAELLVLTGSNHDLRKSSRSVICSGHNMWQALEVRLSSMTIWLSKHC